MSSSPSRLTQPPSPHSSVIERSSAEPLTISQALLITAGMAGLIGLVSGALIRFSFANSSNARFLSPLQTFPASANWTPESPLQAPANAPNNIEIAPPEQTTTTIPTFETREPTPRISVRSPEEFLRKEPVQPPLDSNDDIGIGSAPITTFDAFADRKAVGRRVSDPLETLRQGPALGRGVSEENGLKDLAGDLEANDEDYPAEED